MASCTTPKSPQNDTCPTFTLTVTLGSSTGTTQNLDWEFSYTTYGYAVDGGSVPYILKINGKTVKESTYSIGGKGGSTSRTIATGSTTVDKGTSSKSVSFSIHVDWGITWTGVYVKSKDASSSITVGAKTSYIISYNANGDGASGAPSSQTKWYGSDLKLSSTKPTRNHYTFSKWNTKSDGSGTSYNPGSTYTSNSAATLYAIWIPDTYTVSYNLNGGSGAISSQTKTYNRNLTLTSTKPSRTNYTFVKWNTKSDGSGTSYNPGSTYTSNAAATLYAIWKLAIQKPTISDFKVQRCTSSGSLTDEGTYAKITFSWSCDQATGDNPVTAITVNGSSTGITVSGNRGSVSVIRGTYSVESSYTITAKVVDTKTGGDGTSASRILPTKKYAIDFLPDAGVAIGGVANKANTFKCYLPMESTSLITAAGFRLNDRSSNIGTVIVKDISTAVSVSSYGETTTAKALGSISLPIGTWVITGSVQFTGKSGGVRLVNLSTLEASTGYANQHAVRDGSNDSYDKVMQVTYIHANTSEETIYLNAAQNSGSAINCKGWIRAVRIA